MQLRATNGLDAHCSGGWFTRRMNDNCCNRQVLKSSGCLSRAQPSAPKKTLHMYICVYLYIYICLYVIYMYMYISDLYERAESRA